LLTKLSIKNFALIDSLEIDFSNGFSIITGDTGSGKSILLNALSLIVGERVDHSSLKNDQFKCIIEGEFDLKSYELKKIFLENDLDYFQHSILRREILPNGKSRSFVNDSPVKLEIMKSIGEKLVDIHTQNQLLVSSKDDFFFSLVDSLSEQQNIVTNFSQNLSIYKEMNLELEKLNRLNASLQNDYDYNQFLFNELNNAKLRDGEQEELEESLKVLKNSEEIILYLNEIDNLFQNDPNCIENQIRNLNSILNNLSNYSDKFQEYKNRIESVLIELDDVKLELRNSSMNFNHNSTDLDGFESRLNLIYNLQKKTFC
jgi:DNA repair protein RecN (Recombination protein N)